MEFKHKKTHQTLASKLSTITVEDTLFAAPQNIEWRECTIIIVDGASPPGALGTKRYKKNLLARKFAGEIAAKWISAWDKVDPKYPVTINNARMCLESGYFVLRTPDGNLVNELS
jgi:hypothetical protein